MPYLITHYPTNEVLVAIQNFRVLKLIHRNNSYNQFP